VNAPTKQQQTIAKWGLIEIALLLLVIAVFLDPIGSSPDSGVVDLDPTGTKWFLGGLGALWLLGGAWVNFKNKSSGPK
jgi:hypothetical protein